MLIAYRGNHQPDLPPDVPPWSTESHLAASLELLGHEVVRVHEKTDSWDETIRKADGYDLFLWTSTWPFAASWPASEAFRSVAYLGERMPTVAVHLDRWWGLAREQEVTDRRRGNAMFRCRWVFTADGDHDDAWARYDINHRWLPPGIYAPDVYRGTPRAEYAADVAFVGSHAGYTHPEHWPTRLAVLDAVRGRYGDRARFWPVPGEPAVRGRALNDLYASTKVAVGDAWQGASRYWSDRVFETVGRGCVIVMPHIAGLADMLPEGAGIAYYPPGDTDAMCAAIDRWLADDEVREVALAKGMDLVAAEHTYTHRMQQMLDTLEAEGAWR